MILQDLDKLVDKVKRKPRLYNYVCHAGSSVGPLVNQWGPETTYICNSARPDGGWINGPRCKKCNGIIEGVLDISDREKSINYGIEELASEIRNLLHKEVLL